MNESCKDTKSVLCSDHEGISKRLTCLYKTRVKFLTDVISCEVYGMYDGFETITNEDSIIHGVKSNLDPNIIGSIKSDLSCLEFVIHVSIIYIETLMNKKRTITLHNLDSIKSTLVESITYFEWWFYSAKSQKKDSKDREWEKSVLSKVTYTNLRFGVRGFIRFAEIVLERGYYVPMQMSSTSSIEAVFSQVRSHKCDTPKDFKSKITLLNSKKSMSALSTNKMYSKDDEQSQNMVSLKFRNARWRKAEMKRWQKKKVPNVSVESIPIMSNLAYEKYKNATLPTKNENMLMVIKSRQVSWGVR